MESIATARTYASREVAMMGAFGTLVGLVLGWVFGHVLFPPHL